MTKFSSRFPFKLSAAAIALFLTLAVAGGALAQSAAMLTVAPDAGSGGDPSIYHFTPEEGSNGQGISHVFTLRNDTQSPITIARVDASCSCTTAVLQTGSAQTAPADNTTVSPGQSVKLKVTVSFGDEASGDIDKIVMVRVANQADPAATLHVVGTIVPLVIFAPQSMDFGQAAAGQEHSLIFAAGISPRAPNLGPNPVPVCSVPYVRIAPYKGPFADPNFPKNYRTLVYRATLPVDAPMGPFDGTINFVNSDVMGTMPVQGGGTALVLGGPSGPSTAPVPPAVSPTGRLPVRGELVGDLKATPQEASFGTVAAGKAASDTITVASKSGKDLSEMTFTSDQPWLSAKLAAEGASGNVEIDIAANAPAGAQAASVTARIDGEKIVIPVMAYIVAGG